MVLVRAKGPFCYILDENPLSLMMQPKDSVIWAENKKGMKPKSEYIDCGLGYKAQEAQNELQTLGLMMKQGYKI